MRLPRDPSLPAARARRCLAALLLTTAACGGARATPVTPLVAGAPAAPQPTQPFDLAQLLPLGFPDSTLAGGDTVLVVLPGRPRVLVLRHGPDDPDVFALLRIGPTTFAGADSVRIRVVPEPDRYGVTLTADHAFAGPAVLEFAYGRHFAAPPAAVARYGSPLGFERALAIAFQVSPTQAVLLPSSRPALDHLATEITANGRYFAAALP